MRVARTRVSLIQAGWLIFDVMGFFEELRGGELFDVNNWQGWAVFI
jgi:hypothetical protein